jgi:NADH dehydrogenase
VNVVVAGGTGFIGRHVTKALVDGGHRVTVMSRNPASTGRIPELAGTDAVHGDVTDPRTLTGKLDGADAVVASVQFPNHPVEAPRKGLTYDRYDRQGTENLLAEAADAGVRRFFYLSGAGADSRSPVVWYRALNKVAFMARYLPVVLQVGVKPQRIQPVWVGDVALAVRRAFERDDAWGAVYEIGGPDVMTMNEVIHTMLDVMGKKRAVIPIPAWLAKAGTAPLRILPNPPMTPQGIEFAIQPGIVDTRLVRERLDVRPIGLREGLSRYL